MLTSRGISGRSRQREVHATGDSLGSIEGPGSLVCVECGFGMSLPALDEHEGTSAVPACPVCGGEEFRRASIFDQPTVAADAIEPKASRPAWLTELRVDAPPGPALAFWDEAADEARMVEIAEGWTRIGRSAAADLRLDHPSVSRRHALVVRTEAGSLRALDDRSLNGLFVNGNRVEWISLADGDELEIGSFRLFVVVGPASA